MEVAAVGAISEGRAIAPLVRRRYRAARERPFQAAIRDSRLFALLDPRGEFLFVVRRHGSRHQLDGCADATTGVAVGKPHVFRLTESVQSVEASAILVPIASLCSPMNQFSFSSPFSSRATASTGLSGIAR